MQAILDRCRDGSLPAEPTLLICNNPKAKALERAKSARFPGIVINGKTHPNPDALDKAMMVALIEAGIELVILAGYMKLLGPATLAAFRNRIVNIHPSLLPNFGGKGMFGIRIHEAVLQANEKVTGATVHLVDGDYDDGQILQQATVQVLPDDTPESLQARVLKTEHLLYPDTIAKIVRGEIALTGNSEPKVNRPT